MLVCSDDDPRVTMTKSENKLNNGYFGNYCSLRPESWQKQTTNEGVRLILVKVIS